MNNILIGAAGAGHGGLGRRSVLRVEVPLRAPNARTWSAGSRRSAVAPRAWPTLLRAGRLSSNPVLGGTARGHAGCSTGWPPCWNRRQVGGTVATQLLFSALLALAGAARRPRAAQPGHGARCCSSPAARFPPSGSSSLARVASRKMSEQLPSAPRHDGPFAACRSLIEQRLQSWWPWRCQGPSTSSSRRAPTRSRNLGVSFYPRRRADDETRSRQQRPQHFSRSRWSSRRRTGGNLVEMLEKGWPTPSAAPLSVLREGWRR